jgi:hypothetical protein
MKPIVIIAIAVVIVSVAVFSYFQLSANSEQILLSQIRAKAQECINGITSQGPFNADMNEVERCDKEFRLLKSQYTELTGNYLP